jgi:hypothetical protein
MVHRKNITAHICFFGIIFGKNSSTSPEIKTAQKEKVIDHKDLPTADTGNTFESDKSALHI